MKHACPFLKRASWITLRLRQLEATEANGGRLELGMSCEESDRLLPSPALLCSSSFVRAPTVEHLYFMSGSTLPRRQDDIDNNLWLELLHPIIAVKSLYISWIFMPGIGDALQMLIWE